MQQNDSTTTDPDWITRDIQDIANVPKVWGDDDGLAAFDLEDRAAVTRMIRWIPGTVNVPFLWPLTLVTKITDGVDPDDGVNGNIQGCYWVSSDNGSGVRITNFSEDYVTVGTTRYLCFHSILNTRTYNYIAFEMNV